MANASGRLVFYSDVPKLYDLASVSLTSNLLQDHIVEKLKRQRAFEPFNEQPEEYLTTRVTTNVKHSIGSLVRSMEKNRTNWWHFHFGFVFDRSCRNDMIDVLAELVWLPDGSIDHEATARKMVTDSRLSAREQFRMAAMYCLGDEVKRAREAMTTTSLRKISAMKNFPQVAYWCQKMTDGGMCGGGDFTSVCYQIMHLLDFENWSAIKYFWNASSADQRHAILYDVMSQSTKPGIMIKFLAQLSPAKVDSILRQHGRQIVWAMASQPRYSGHIPVVYKRILELNAFDVEQLGDSLIDVSMEDFRRGRAYLNGIVQSMWRNTSEELKNGVARRWAHELIEQHLDRILSKPEDYDDNCNIPFIVDVLKRVDQKFRSEYWQKYWPKLTVGQIVRYPDQVELIMKLCLVTDEKIAEFKATKMTNIDLIKPFYQKLIVKGRFEDVQGYVSFVCSNDAQKMIDLKRKILKTSYEQVFSCLMDESVHMASEKFANFIAGTYTTKGIKLYKNLLFTSPENISELYGIGSMVKAMHFVDQHVTDPSNLATVKIGLLEYVRQAHLDIDVFNMSKDQWIEFMNWCFFNDSALIEEFKKSLQTRVNRLFVERVSFLVNLALSRLHVEPDPYDNHSVDSLNKPDPDDAIPTLMRYLDDFQQLLLWIFDTKQEVAKFKVQRIQSYAKSEDLKKALSGENGQGIVKAILLWVFDRDERQIRSFKKNNRL